MTTDSNQAYITSENLLDRNMTVLELSKKWVADLAYVSTLQGWLYLSIIMDSFDRRIIRWLWMRQWRHLPRINAAFKMTIGNGPMSLFELIFHSDSRIQYARKEFREQFKPYKVDRSTSRKGNCWDNAVAENFFKIIKSEIIYHTTYVNRAKARAELFKLIAIWYIVKRKHSYLNYLTPDQFGKTTKTKAA
jgi:transposase InsO family protein